MKPLTAHTVELRAMRLKVEAGTEERQCATISRLKAVLLSSVSLSCPDVEAGQAQAVPCGTGQRYVP